jgi:Cupin superfamily protein
VNSKLSLRWLIQPVETKTFFEQYFERQPLVVRRGQPDYFGELLSYDEIDRVITTLDRSSDEIAVKNANREVTEKDYAVDGSIDVAKLYQQLGEGSTIRLAHLDTVLPQLTRLCRSLEGEFTCPFQANIYLTPREAQGAKVHYDTHDVFVLQVAGSKKWTMYGTPVELPLAGQDFDATIHHVGEATLEFELAAGDVAYIPRGVAHDARSMETMSLHVTAGILRFTWLDFLLELVASAGLHDVALRKSLPPGFAHTGFDRHSVRGRARELLQRISEQADFDPTLQHFVDEFFSNCRPLLPGQMAQMAMADRLTAECVAGVRDGAIFRTETVGDVIVIECYGRRITFPAQLREAVEFALQNPRFTVRELPVHLDDAGKLVIVRRLIREGLVAAVIAD